MHQTIVNTKMEIPFILNAHDNLHLGRECSLVTYKPCYLTRNQLLSYNWHSFNWKWVIVITVTNTHVHACKTNNKKRHYVFQNVAEEMCITTEPVTGNCGNPFNRWNLVVGDRIHSAPFTFHSVITQTGACKQLRCWNTMIHTDNSINNN